MENVFVRLANRAHGWASPWSRRATLIVAMAGLALLSIAFWLLAPLLLALMLALSTVKAFVEELVGMPAMISETARVDWQDWRDNIKGAVSIWRAQKQQ